MNVLSGGRLGRALALALLACCAAAGPCLALDAAKAITQYNRQVWTTVQGLPQGSVLAIAQAPDGYLWLGTRTGLARFDGATFTLFEPSPAPGGLPSGAVQSLRAAKDGSVWIGTDGKGIVRYRAGEFSSDPRLSADSGNGFHVDEAGRLWVATWNGVLVLDGGQVRRADRAAGLSHNSVFAVTGDGRGRVWAATSVGLVEFRDGRLASLPAYAQIPEPQCLLVDRNGALWVGSASGLHRIEGERVSSFTTADGLLANFVTALAEDRDGNVWIGTEGGLNRWSAGRIDGASRIDGLSGSAVASLLEDREGSLWVGLRGTGLVRLQEGALTSYGRAEGLAEDNVRCVFQSRDGSLWFGTTHGLTRLKKGRLEVFTRRDGLLNDSITGLGEHPEFGVVIATYAKRLNTYRDGRIGVLPKLTIGETIPSVVHTDRERALWVGTLGGGLYRMKDGRIEHHAFADSAGRHVTYGVHEDARGVLWFATPNGVLRHERGRFTEVEIYRQGANLGVTHAIHGDETGLWIATRDRGVCRLRDGDKSVRCYGVGAGLLDDTVYTVLEDDSGRLFLSTPRGIGVVSGRDLEALGDGSGRVAALRLGIEDGMSTSECQGTRWPAGWKASDGRLWFPTARGVVSVEPTRVRGEAPPPPVVVERVTVDGRTHDARGRVNAPPGRREIEFAYASLSFRGSERTRFRYRLEGFDASWREAGTRRIAHYTNIPPGRYRFRLSAAREGGSWNEEEATVELDLAPHFYETRAWIVAVLLAGAGLVWLGYEWRLRRLSTRAEELSRRVQEALANAKVLSGLLPICASCKRIRSDKGYWEQIEAYIGEHSQAEFSHGLCPSCVRQLFPEIAERVLETAERERSGGGKQ